ncbi:MAG TPA: hypothetical protein VKY74_15645, partial [Chloroflexia bacterium]|nr:hypothetical protein [Chloroflexia bacterium]
YGLPRQPIHLWQHNPALDAHANPRGCGAFSTAMALSVYDPARYGRYSAARALFAQMAQVPVFGGTFENQNAVVAGQAGFMALNRDHGTVAELVAAVDLGAPVILLIAQRCVAHRPQLSRHRPARCAAGGLPRRGGRPGARSPDRQPRPGGGDPPGGPGGTGQPGNPDLGPPGPLDRHLFTPIFASPAVARAWQAQVGR